MAEHDSWCVLCMQPLSEGDTVVSVLPDGCVAHNACWLKADYREVEMHGRPAHPEEKP